MGSNPTAGTINIMIISVCLLKLNILNKNNRIYTQESFEKLPNEIFIKDCSASSEPSFSDYIGISNNVRIENDELLCDIDFTQRYKICESLLKSGNYVVRANSTAIIDENTREVKNAIITSASLVPKDLDSFG